MTTAPETWIYNKKVPSNSFSMPTEASAFASSSLASSASSDLAVHTTKWGDLRLQPLIQGRQPTTIYATDKSSLGTEYLRQNEASAGFSLNLNPMGMTTPNIYTLRRSSLLR